MSRGSSWLCISPYATSAMVTTIQSPLALHCTVPPLPPSSPLSLTSTLKSTYHSTYHQPHHTTTPHHPAGNLHILVFFTPKTHTLPSTHIYVGDKSWQFMAPHVPINHLGRQEHNNHHALLPPLLLPPPWKTPNTPITHICIVNKLWQFMAAVTPSTTILMQGPHWPCIALLQASFTLYPPPPRHPQITQVTPKTHTLPTTLTYA
jgi:hypothetical protein